MVKSILPLVFKNASVRRRGKVLVGPVDFVLTETGFTIVIGPNGSGKTTLLRLMHGLERLSGGSAKWQAPDPEVRQRQSYVFQSPIMMRRSVRDNLAYPLIVHGTPKTEARAQAWEWASRINLADAFERFAPLLSGGEKQKLALARALIRKPDVLFLDEPCANLDGRATREIEAILREAHAGGTRIVMATHDMGQARRLASDVLFLLKGHLHDQGPAAAFFANPQTPETNAFLNGDIVE
ncbi:MAG: energy-coupling factor ABC transporter ATP-binding protein [Halocynthiibacter sp.]